MEIDPKKLEKLLKQRKKVLDTLEDLKKGHKIYMFNTKHLPANPLQAELLAAWDDSSYKVFTYTGANRIGKCLSENTYLDTPNGQKRIGDLYEKRESFEVFAWDGRRKVVAKATAPFKKEGLHQCYRLQMADGQVLEAADHHRILTSRGWTNVDALYTCFPNLQGTSWEHDPLILSEDDLRLSETTLGYQDGCFESYRRCGVRLLSWLNNVQVSSPSLTGVRLRDSVLSGLGEWGRKCTNNLKLIRDHLSIQDVLNLSADLFFGFLYRIGGRTWSPFYAGCQLSRKLSNVGAFGFQPDHVIGQRRLSVCGSSETPFNLIGDNSIESITPISSCKEVYDFHVPGYRNYFAGGIVHHNTTISAIIIIATMMGKWPWDNQKIPFPHFNARKIRWVGQDWQKHIKTVVLPSIKEWWPQDRTAKTKKDNQGIETFWEDVATGSTLEIMSNKQEADLLEGWHGDLIVYDEPPKRDIRVACARGLIDRQGRELFAMTLLKEAWVDREVIKARLDNGRPDPTVYNIHGEIYANVGFGITKEGVAQFEKTLTDEQKEARLKGVPSYMRGLVLPDFKRKVHLVERFEVPTNWMVDIAIDVHPRERQAVLFTATDERGYRYCVNEIWAHGDGKFIGDNIVRCVAQNAYRVNRVIIDPLAKGDSNQDLTTFETIARILARRGMVLEVASKDKENGILFIKDHLKGPNNKPSLFIFNDLVRTIMEIEGWMYDDQGKPRKEDDHFCENLYRTILLNTKYVEPEDEDYDDYYHQENRSAVTGY